jgi:hypothetical protein
VEWVQLVLAALVGLGVGGWWQRRHASREAEKQRAHASSEARATREHASAEARAARRFQIRFEAYKAASHYLSKHERWVSLTEPLMGPAPDPPDLSPDEEWVEFGGVIAVTASDRVRDAMRAAVDAEIAFDFAVREYRRSNQGGKVDSENPGLAMHEAREAAIAAIQSAQTVMRDELTDL